MAITDRGLPEIDPHTMLKNLVKPIWILQMSLNPVVNQEWLEFKLQKTYEICITPVYQETEMVELNDYYPDPNQENFNPLHENYTFCTN